MKKATVLLIISVFFTYSNTLFATDFLDVQTHTQYVTDSNAELINSGLFVAVASEDSLRYREYDSKMRVEKETVWNDDFSAVSQIIEWLYEEDVYLPIKKIVTNKKDNSSIEIVYEYDSKGRTKSNRTETVNGGTVIQKRTEYSYHEELNDGGNTILLADSKIYINDILSQEVTWLSVNDRKVVHYFDNNIITTTVYTKGLKKSELITQDGEQIGQRSWD